MYVQEDRRDIWCIDTKVLTKLRKITAFTKRLCVGGQALVCPTNNREQ